MNINRLLKQKNMTKYRLAKTADLPQSTVTDICSGKAKLENCSSGTLYKLAKALDVSMESLVAEAMEYRADFEIFKSNVCHKIKELGDLDFLIDTVKSDRIRYYFNKQWYPESLYLLAMVDYLCRENNLSVCAEYNDLRGAKLSDTLYPAGIHMMCSALKSDEPKKTSIESAIPEFMRFNIVENEVRNVT